MARDPGISEETVRNHVSNIYKKLHTKSDCTIGYYAKDYKA